MAPMMPATPNPGVTPEQYQSYYEHHYLPVHGQAVDVQGREIEHCPEDCYYGRQAESRGLHLEVDASDYHHQENSLQDRGHHKEDEPLERRQLLMDYLTFFQSDMLHYLIY